jgi:GTP-binding protein
VLVDAVEGPMPQTRFVTQKAFACGLVPLVVINKIDRDGARPDWVLDQTFDLFDRLGATEEQLDFPVIYASALQGYAGTEPNVRDGDMTPLLEAIVSEVPPPSVDASGPLQLQVSSLDYDPYVGVLGIGRIQRGEIETNARVSIVAADGSVRNARVLELYGFEGLERKKIPSASAGDIIVFSGIDDLAISDTLCPRDKPEGRRADHQHDLPGEQGTVRRQGRQVPDEPADQRAPAAGTQAQRRAARRKHRGPGQVLRLRPRRTASLRAYREHAPRRF